MASSLFPTSKLRVTAILEQAGSGVGSSFVILEPNVHSPHCVTCEETAEACSASAGTQKVVRETEVTVTSGQMGT